MVDNTPKEQQIVQQEGLQAGKDKKARQRSPFLFPAYNFTIALDIARRVEEKGAGTLAEDTLAVDMGLSVTSSGFRLKCLTARQFGLLSKQGEILSTTPIAKSILKPTNDQDAINGYRQAFLNIPLFRAVADRYKGQPLPVGQTFRNILERDLRIEVGRVQAAERILLDSARDAQVLVSNGDKVYLSVTGQNPLSPAAHTASNGDGNGDSGGSGTGIKPPPKPHEDETTMNLADVRKQYAEHLLEKIKGDSGESAQELMDRLERVLGIKASSDVA